MKKKIGLLVLAFLLFYSMIHLSRYLPDLYTGRFSLVDERSYSAQLISLIADAFQSFLFTISAYLVLCQFYPSRKFLLLIASLAAVFIACFVINYSVAQLTDPQYLRLSRFFRGVVLYNTMYTIFAMVFFFIQYSLHKELQQRALAIQNRDSELSFLRSQINPHFLFNNLNNIYSMVYHKSDQSLTAISGLSELLRYMLYDSSETITLDKEILYIEKYIALEQLRFEKPTAVNFNFTGDGSQLQLPALLLIPFIENAFKHGKVAFDDTWLSIDIRTTPQQEIVLRCVNDIGIKEKDQTGGIGIENVRKRLDLLYPDNSHQLNITAERSMFSVELKLGTYIHPNHRK